MDVLDAYNDIADAFKLPALSRGGCRSEKTCLTDPDAVWPGLAARSPVTGWLQFQSKQLPFVDGLPEPEPDWGLLLAAEAVTAAGDSIALCLDGAGGWTLTHYQHLPDGDLLYDEPTQLAYDPKTGALRYRRYWRHEPEQGYVQVHACFTGFE